MHHLATAFCATLLAAAPALAGTWSLDNDRILGDPAYLPLHGQLFGEFAYTYAVDSYQFTPPALFQEPTESFHRQRNDFLPYVSYGITNTVSVSAELDFGNTRTSETFQRTEFLFLAPQAGPIVKAVAPSIADALTAALKGLPPGLPSPRGARHLVPVHVNFHSVGAQDPAFAITWRAIGQDRASVNLDLSASYTPDIFQARQATVETTGSRAAGGQRGTAQAAISREMQVLTVRAYATFGYDGRRDTTEPGSVARAGARPDYTAGVQTQIRLLPFLALNTGASVSRAVQFDSVDISTFDGSTYRTSETIRPSTAIEPYAGLVFPLYGRRAVGELLYQRDILSDEKVLEPAGEARFLHQQTNAFTASVRFVIG